MHPRKVLTFSKIGEGYGDPDLKIAPNEAVLNHFIIPLAHNVFLIYPLKECIHVRRGLIVKAEEGEIISV